MGVFLAFGSDELLIGVMQAGTGDFGAADPMRVCSGGGARRALELHPSILLKIRPPTWQALVGHARYTPNGLQVRPLEEIQETVRELARMSKEAELVHMAAQIVTIEAAATLLGGLPASQKSGMANLRGGLEKAKTALANLDANPPPVSQQLVDLAGRLLPL